MRGVQIRPSAALRLFLASLIALSTSGRASGAIIPVERNPFAPASQQVQARITTIEAEIQRLQLAGQIADADAMRSRLTHFQAQFAGTAPSDGAGSELDIVEVYEGFGAIGANPGTASVHLTATDRPLVLALGSYESVNWTLAVDPGVTIAQMIVSSYYASQITNPPPGVPVVTANASVGHGLNYENYPAGERLFRSLSGGRPVTSVYGRYTASSSQVLVGPGNADWRAQRVLREMHPLYLDATAHQREINHAAAAALQFSGLLQYYTGTGHDNSHHSVYSRMSIDGPVAGTRTPLNIEFDNFVTTPDGQIGYGTAGNFLFRVTMADGQATPMTVAGPGVPTLSIPCGVAFDSTRNRLVVASLGGEGFLYAYVDNPQQWFLMNSLQNTDLQSLTYLASDDSLYGLTNRANGSTGEYRIRKYNSAGNFLGEVSIGETVPSTDFAGVEGMQLMAAGNYLALLTPPTPDLYQLDRPDQYRIFLIKPSDGSVIYYGEFPIPEPSILGVSAATLLFAGRRRGRQASMK